MTQSTPDDEHSHFPGDDADETWQESWAFAWFDPLAHIGGWHHMGLARNRNVADLASAIWVRGEFVHRYHSLSLPIPVNDMTGFSLGPLDILTRTPLREHVVTVRDPSASAILECTATTAPLGFSYASAKGHWEVYGRFSGEVTTPAGVTRVRGHSFIDRSWGARDWSAILTYRLVWACFGKDLAFKIYHLIYKSGPHIFGFVIVDGVRHDIVHADFETMMAMDGLHPKSVTVVAWTEEGAAYRLHGVSEGADVTVQRDGFLASHANAAFEHGGRLGTGFVEVQELKKPPPWDTELLGMIGNKNP